MPIATVSPQVAPKKANNLQPATPKTPSAPPAPSSPSDSTAISPEAREEERLAKRREMQEKIREIANQTVWTKPQTGDELRKRFQSQSVRRFLGN